MRVNSVESRDRITTRFISLLKVGLYDSEHGVIVEKKQRHNNCLTLIRSEFQRSNNRSSTTKQIIQNSTILVNTLTTSALQYGETGSPETLG